MCQRAKPNWFAQTVSSRGYLGKDASASTVMASPNDQNSAGSSVKESLEAGLAALKQKDYPTAIALLESLTQTAANGAE